MEAILNLNQLDVHLLDQVIHVMYSGNRVQQQEAQRVLTMFKDHPEAWLKVDTILEHSQLEPTKFFALQVLEPVIQYRWKSLPRQQCDAIKGYILDKVVSISSTENGLRVNNLYLKKLDEVLVQIIKQEWPNNWGSFVQEIVGASKTNEYLCENNMQILKLLSEEIFDFSRGKLTQARTDELKQQFAAEFSQIYSLCEFVLTSATKPSLLAVSLEALLGFLSWIPLGYIFETNMVDLLIRKFFPEPSFRNRSLKCLTEIASLKLDSSFDQKFVQFLVGFVQALEATLPPTIGIPEAFENANSEERTFIQNLAIFFSVFFKTHLGAVEATNAALPTLVLAHQYLANISLVEDDEIFKICLEYWSILAVDLYNDPMAHSDARLSSNVLQLSGGGPTDTPRRQMYNNILTTVRIALISKMQKPEEVLIVEDENGELIREEFPDTEAISAYNSMRETLIYLTHLNTANTIDIMSHRLKDAGRSRHTLNTLCWAIGSISGVQTEDDERKFLVIVIKELLNMCDKAKVKDDKAVIASNIMYIVGQYPRFLRAHWKFLKTVVRKLFEFMHEPHPGVKDMACDTFLKIAKSCNQKFVVHQIGESQPFVNELLQEHYVITQDLQPSQIQTFYEAVGYMIAAQGQEGIRVELIKQLMRYANARWTTVIQTAENNLQFLQDPKVAKQDIVVILRTNLRVASSLGSSYKHQLGTIFVQTLQLYKVYSNWISEAIHTQGEVVTGYATIRAYRAVKRETLRLLQTFVEHIAPEDVQEMSSSFIPAILEAILEDYRMGIDAARDPEVLSLMTAVVCKFKSHIIVHIPKIYDCIFEVTIDMIKKNFEDYPDHRVNVFRLIKSINQFCFGAFFAIAPEKFKLTIDSIVWAFKHTARNISDSGLNILIEMLKNIQNSEVADAFYQTYLLSLLHDLFVVLTDTLHKSGFSMQATLIMEIIRVVQIGGVHQPLWDTNTANYANNQQFLLNYIAQVIGGAFSNLSQQQVEHFALGLFQHCDNPHMFKQHLRDFLVEMKEFKGSDNSELYEQNTASGNNRENVPGLIKPIELEMQRTASNYHNSNGVQ